MVLLLQVFILLNSHHFSSVDNSFLSIFAITITVVIVMIIVIVSMGIIVLIATTGGIRRVIGIGNAREIRAIVWISTNITSAT